MPRLVKKSKPIGIRFDIDRSREIMTRENIGTYQGLVNYLVSFYELSNVPSLPKELTIDDCPYKVGIERTLWINQNLKK
jgi:hypothetical protein